MLLVVWAGVLFQYPGFLIAALVGAGAANFLKHPAPWLEGIIAGAATPRCAPSVKLLMPNL